MKNKILLLDGFNLLFRGFYALPLLTNDEGEYTNAVYGFMNIFLRFLDEEKPTHIAVAFDLPEPTFRHKRYAEYKATRGETPLEFTPQIPLLVGLLRAMNIPIVSCAGYEADDVLGTLARLAEARGFESVIISSDRDLLQVVSDTVKVRAPKAKTVEDYYAADVTAKYGVSPQAFIDVKALMGDTSDNVPGVPGIGEKTATKIIQAYGSVENAIAHAAEVKPKRASENLTAYAEQALLSKELVTISLDAPVEFDFGPLGEIWTEAAYTEAKRLNFKSILPRFSRPHSEEKPKDIKFQLACYVLNEMGIDAEYDELLKRIDENEQTFLFHEIELPLAEVLADMERFGIKIDRGALIAYGEALDVQIDRLTGEIYELSGEEFNIQSPKQLQVVLFEKLGLPGTKKTKSGFSTAADVLKDIEDKHPVIAKILAYRTHAKLKSTYVDGLLPLIDPRDSRVRSTFNQTLTSTGRISSSEPNLQNIPVRTELGRELRKVFVPEDGYVFIDADYSQIELRVLAHMSGDETLIRAFHEGQDIHRLTASQVFRVPLGEVSAEQRHAAKAVNFGIIYGISSHGLVQDLHISHPEAQMYIDGYFRQYPRVKEFMERTIAEAKEKGYVSTIFNRRRLVPELKSRNYATRSFGERAAMNMPIQGTAADIIKIAMLRTSARLKAEGLQSRLILQVHDELLLEVEKSETAQVKALLQEEMEGAAKLSVPLVAELHEGNSWFDAK